MDYNNSKFKRSLLATTVLRFPNHVCAAVPEKISPTPQHLQHFGQLVHSHIHHIAWLASKHNKQSLMTSPSAKNYHSFDRQRPELCWLKNAKISNHLRSQDQKIFVSDVAKSAGNWLFVLKLIAMHFIEIHWDLGMANKWMQILTAAFVHFCTALAISSPARFRIIFSFASIGTDKRFSLSFFATNSLIFRKFLNLFEMFLIWLPFFRSYAKLCLRVWVWVCLCLCVYGWVCVSVLVC